MTLIRTLILYFNYFCMAYTLVLSFIYIFQFVISFIKIKEDTKVGRSSDYEKYAESENLLPISLIIPAYNEEEHIVQNVKSLMKMNYPEFELIVVNDGSTDKTHTEMIDAFSLYPIESAHIRYIETSKVRNVYYNVKYPNLIYVDKENGGKSDALNAGMNASSYPLFACLDADSRLEKDSLLRLGSEFIKDTTTVVAGGLVRIANGAVIRDGVFESFKLPEKAIEKFQIVEYFRSFLSGRTSWGMTNSMLIVSGAFGVFKKQAVVDVGGYKTDTIGEDMEIVVRIHEHMLRNRIKYRVKFCEEAICWTQGPMELGDVRTQRRRWQVGLMDTLLHYKRLFLNPLYKSVGLFAVPYNWFFELLGAVVEAFGYFIIPFSLIIGELNPFFFVTYFLLATMLGIIISFGGLILEQYTKRGVMTSKQCMQLALYGILENFGYRQMITVFRVEGMLKYRKLKNKWGSIKRKSFSQ